MKNNSRRGFFAKIGIGLASLSLSSFPNVVAMARKRLPKSPQIFFTNGFKTVEVDSHSAILWTRLCAQKKPQPISHQRNETVFRHPIDFDENIPVDQMDGAVKGMAGRVRVKLMNNGKTIVSDWYPAKEENDYTVQIPFENLKADSGYQIVWEAKSNNPTGLFFTEGAFRTAPDPSTPKPIQLVTSTCQYFWSYDNDERGFEYSFDFQTNECFVMHIHEALLFDKDKASGNEKTGTASINLSKGFHPVKVVYQHKNQTDPEFEIRWSGRGFQDAALDVFH